MSPDLALFNRAVRIVQSSGSPTVPHDVGAILAYLTGVGAVLETTINPPFDMARFAEFVRNRNQAGAMAPWGHGRIVSLAEVFRSNARSESEAIDMLWDALNEFMGVQHRTVTAAPSSVDVVAAIYAGAYAHGQAVEPSDEADDLKVFLSEAWEVMNDAQRAMVLARGAVRDVIDNGGYYEGLRQLIGLD